MADPELFATEILAAIQGLPLAHLVRATVLTCVPG
jgi:hypothetical protein